MHLSLGKLVALSSAFLHTGNALSVTILADTNRDGTVDVEGTSDIQDKQRWTEDHGALFLANIGDTDGRCSKMLANSPTWAAVAQGCNDASDNILRQEKYLAPLRTLPIASLSSSATGSIRVTNETAAPLVRIFIRQEQDKTWTYVDPDYVFTAQALEAGLELGIDGRDVRRPSGWDGRATVQFTVQDGDAVATDEVALRVAPVLTHHHAQLAERIFVTNHTGVNQQAFVAALTAEAKSVGITDVFGFVRDRDIWTQDFFEPAYSSIPGPDGPTVIRIMFRSIQKTRSAGAQAFTVLRSAGVGAVQQEPLSRTPETTPPSTIDSHGNLEAIPPYTHNGVSYPAGRIIMGEWDGAPPQMYDFFVAQETQMPLVLQTEWLGVGHVDEFLQFLPSKSERGWVLMADDPIAGLNLMRNASEAGYGAERALVHSRCVSRSTIDDELNRVNFTEINTHAAERIEFNLNLIKEATGLTDDEIIRVPALFWDIDRAWLGCTSTTARLQSTAGNSDLQDQPLNIIEAAARQQRTGGVSKRASSFPQVAAHWPGMVNGIVLTDSHVVAPNPWGPIIEGKDILAEAAHAAYGKANFTVGFIDDYFTHHIGMGEVHCGSNTWRNADKPWW